MNCFKQMTQVIDLDQYRTAAERIPISQPIVQEHEVKKPEVNPKLWIEAISRSDIQKIYHKASLDNCPELPLKIVEIGKRWVKSPKKTSLYLHGCTGSGKTYFSTCLYRALVEKNYPWIIYKKSDDLDNELLEAIEYKQEKSKIQMYSEVPFLFIDDIGVERLNDRVIRQFYTIIDKRVGNGLITVMTSNLAIHQLPLGDRILSRLEHFYSIEFPNTDIRKNIKLCHLLGDGK